MTNPNAFVILVTDSQTASTLTDSRKLVFNYIDKNLVIKVNGETKLQRSRIIKTTLRNYIDGNYLFIDSDTIICSSLDDIDLFPYEIGAVLDRHMCLSKHPCKDLIKKGAATIDWNITSLDEYFNSGVFYVKDTPNTKMLYEEWHRLWCESVQNGGYLDQPALGKANSKLGYIIKELPGEWNCQIMENGLKYLSSSRIIHYYAEFRGKHKDRKSYLFSNAKYYKMIKEHGGVPDEILYMLQTPKSAFSDDNYICCDEELKVVRSRQFQLSKYLIKSHSKIFAFIESILNGIISLAYKK
jgi:lipopolysaccharide biosynthesis glycosyltransferase